MKSLALVSLVCVFLSAVECSRVRKCGVTTSPQEDARITMDACERLPCKLVRSKAVNVEMKFTPENDITQLKNSVSANILGVPFPFIGVDGKAVCDKLFDASGAQAGCNLKAGQEYVYKDHFDVLSVYPKIKVWVHWALVDNNGAEQVCFEVPVKITD